MSDIEALLRMQAEDDYQQSNNASNVAAALGALTGGVVGHDVGRIELGMQRAPGDLSRKIQDMVNPQYVDVVDPKSKVASREFAPRQRNPGIMQRVTPGPRLAGTLVGTILGGLMGKTATQQLMGESEGARLLAKAQTNPQSMTATDMQRIEQLIVDQQRATGII